jgi:DNA gyrase subunit A
VKDEDFIDKLFVANTHDTLLCFSSSGKLYWLKVYQLPQASRGSRGKPIVNLLPLQEGERITAVVPIHEFEADKFVFMATARGTVKKTSLDAFSRPRQAGIIAVELDIGDRLVNVDITDGTKEIVLCTTEGKAIRFNEDDVRPMGRAAAGVRGMKLRPDDEVVSVDLARNDVAILIVTESGYGKRTQLERFNTQGRGGQGVIGMKLTARKGYVVAAFMVGLDDDIVAVSSGGVTIRMSVRDISSQGRDATGVRVMNLDNGQTVASVAPILAANGDDES